MQRAVTTRAGSLKGKAPYMSPEQCVGKPLDRRSDVFGLGIVLYELATTRRLFKAASEFLSMSAVVLGEVPPPSTHRPDLPLELDAIALRALAKSPEARYPTAEALRAALEQLAVSQGLRTSPKALADYMRDTFGERLEPWRNDAVRAPVAHYAETAQPGVVVPPPVAEAMVQTSSAASPLAIAQAAAEATTIGAQDPEFESEAATVIATEPPEFVHESASRTATTVAAPTRGERPAETDQLSTTTRRPLPPDEIDEASTTTVPLDQVDTLVAQSRDAEPAVEVAEPAPPVAPESIRSHAPAWRRVWHGNPALVIASIAALAIVLGLALALATRHV
jgi:hypothetical protein